MKKIVFVSLLALITTIAVSQDPIFRKNDLNINVGAGLATQIHPQALASFDYGIAEEIADFGSVGVGPYLGLGISSKYTHLSIGARGTFHYPLIDKLDTYAGISMGMRYEFSSFYENNTHPVPGIFIGANYPVNRNLTLFGEFGTWENFLMFGVTFNR